MSMRTFFSMGLRAVVAIAAFLALLGSAQAQTVQNWQQVCWGTNWSSYDMVRVTYRANDCGSWYQSNVYVNGNRIGSQCDSGQITFPGSYGVSLSASYQGGWSWSSWTQGFNYGSCPVSFEDTANNIEPREGYFTFEVGNFPAVSLSVSKYATPTVLAVGASGQSYTITVNVSNGPSKEAIYLTDALPVGLTTGGQITASGGGYVYNCPAAGSTTLSGCYIPAGANGPVYINVPVSISATAVSHNSYSITNTASVTGGGPSACSSGYCQGSTTNAVMHAVDDTDTKPSGVQTSTDVSVNDVFPPGSTFTATGGSCTSPSPLRPSTNTTGVLSYTVPTGSQSCTVNYQLCAPSPSNTACVTATLTVNANSPGITVSKQLNGNRAVSTDQFTVQVLQGSTVVNSTANSTSAGTGSAVTVGSGTTGTTALTAGTAYTVNEVMASGSASMLGQYGSTVSCSNNNAGGTDVSGISKLGDGFTAAVGDAISCRVTNTARGVTLQVRQLVQGPVPVNIIPPISFTYPDSNNGWTQQTLTNASLNNLTSSTVKNLTATNTDTTVYTTLPDTRWHVSNFSCTDTNAAVTGNSPGVLVSVKKASVTIPAAYVLAGSALRCTIQLGHSVP